MVLLFFKKTTQHKYIRFDKLSYLGWCNLVIALWPEENRELFDDVLPM